MTVKRVAIDEIDAAANHVRDVEDTAGRVDLHVLRLGIPAVQVLHTDNALSLYVDLHDLARELTTGDEVSTIAGEVQVVDAQTIDLERLYELEGVRVAEVEALEALRDDDRVLPVRCEVHVVRILDRDRRAWLSRSRIDRRQAVAPVVGDIERLQVPSGHHVLR